MATMLKLFMSTGPIVAAEKRRKLEEVRKRTSETACRVIHPDLQSVQKGYAAEALFVYRAILAGVDVLLPSRAMKACDVVVRTTTGKYLSIEVKGTFGRNVHFLRVRPHTGATHKYTEEDHVDFFVGVDLENENVFVMPSSVVGTQQVFSTLPDTEMWKYLRILVANLP